MPNLFDEEKKTHKLVKDADPVGYWLSSAVLIGCGVPILLFVLLILWIVLS